MERTSRTLSLWLAVAGTTAAGCPAVLGAQKVVRASPREETQPPSRKVEFAAGVFIDWTALQVELPGRIVLREGPLELFACSRRTREHESIVAIDAKPLHVFQALGLIGLEPGKPVAYDMKLDEIIAPTGQPVSVRVSVQRDGESQTFDAWEWLLDAKTNKPAAPRNWLFCGSRYFAPESYGADADGTVVCVVDFDTALIGLEDRHSADNSALWLSANAARIPPLGTPCTLILQAAKQEAIRLACNQQGQLQWQGQWKSPAETFKALEQTTEMKGGAVLIIDCRTSPSPKHRQSIEAAAQAAGIRRLRFTLPTKEATSAPADSLSTGSPDS